MPSPEFHRLNTFPMSKHNTEDLFTFYYSVTAAALIDGDLTDQQIATRAASIATAMLAEHRKRFPLQTESLTPSELVNPAFTYKGFIGALPIHKTPDAILKAFEVMFSELEVPVPKWIVDAMESTAISNVDKGLILKYVRQMIIGRAMNTDADTLKKAFVWADAPGGNDFWEDISKRLPQDEEDQPPTILPKGPEK